MSYFVFKYFEDININFNILFEILFFFYSSFPWRQDNKCTPLHLACGQGALRIVEIMLSNYKTENTLEMQDIEMMTPLHK